MSDTVSQQWLNECVERDNTNRVGGPGFAGRKWTAEASMEQCAADRTLLLELVAELNDALNAISTLPEHPMRRRCKTIARAHMLTP